MRIIGILHRKIGQFRRAAFKLRTVDLRNLFNHDTHRPAIGDDVVHRHDQHMIVSAKL